MKRTYFLQILFILTSFIAFTAQSQELDYAKSRDYWMVDENQNPVISKVFNLVCLIMNSFTFPSSSIMLLVT